MKIIHVEDYFDPTAGYQINELLNASKNFNDEVYLITSNCMKPFHKELDISKDIEFEQKTNVKIIRLQSKFIIASRVFMKGLYKIINDINPDVVFFHGIGDFKDLLLWRKKRKYKIIRDCHMSWVASQNKFRKIYYRVFKLLFSSIINKTNKYDKIYALGEEEYEYLRLLGIKENKIDYLYHGYNDEVMFYDYLDRESIRDKYSIKNDEVLISYIGKFDKFKQPDIIFDIVDNLDLSCIDITKIKLLFIGPKENEYMNKFNSKSIERKIKIDTIIEDSKSFTELRKYFSASDICIFPKECTLSSIHAQVCGAQVIMENYKSNKERVVNDKNLYDINNINHASKILEYILENKIYKDRDLYLKDLSYREYKLQIKKLQKDVS